MIVYKSNYEDEKLFSTGDSELDNILEEVYYSGIEDGYDYAQKEFANSLESSRDKMEALKMKQAQAEYKAAQKKVMAKMEKSKGRVSLAEAKKIAEISPKKRVSTEGVKTAWEKFKNASPEDIEKFGKKVKKTVDNSTRGAKEASAIYRDAYGRYHKLLGEAGSTAKKVVNESRPYIEAAQEAAKKLEPVYKDQRKRVIDAVNKEKGWWEKLAKRATKVVR